MAGTPGTARFGANPYIYPDHTNDSGISHVNTPMDGPWTETHFVYNPGQKSRPMGTTRGGNPGQSYQHVEHQSNYMCNHDGYIGGDMHLMNLDERKVLTNKLYSVPCEYSDSSSNGYAPSMTHGAFD